MDLRRPYAFSAISEDVFRAIKVPHDSTNYRPLGSSADGKQNFYKRN